LRYPVFREEEAYITKLVKTRTNQMKKKPNDSVQRKTGRTSPSTEPSLKPENLSQVQVTEDEKRLLKKRIKYNQPENLT
jgi:hypothetical protein